MTFLLETRVQLQCELSGAVVLTCDATEAVILDQTKTVKLNLSRMSLYPVIQLCLQRYNAAFDCIEWKLVLLVDCMWVFRMKDLLASPEPNLSLVELAVVL